MANSPFDVNLKNYYYIVDGVKYSSKIMALEHANGDLSKIQWYFMDHIWDAQDWTTEPERSMEELLRLRCIQLREQYGYLALWYSSGYDSHTMLTSFVKNNIPIDEIVIMDRRHLFDEKENYTSIANAQYVKDHYFPHLKINVTKVSADENIEFYRKYKDQWIYYPGDHAIFSKWSSYLRGHDPQFLAGIDRHRQINRADIMGLEKPRVLLRDGKWYAFLPDSQAQDFISTQCVKFYHAEELPDLHLKQSWLAIKWFESLPNLTEDFVHIMQGRADSSTLFEDNYEAYNRGFGRVSLRDFELFQHSWISINGHQKYYTSGSYENNVQSLKLYNYAKQHAPDVHKIYHEGVNQILKIKEKYQNTVLLSKQYYIKDLEKQPNESNTL